MRSNRVVIVAGFIGLAIVIVTYVGASRISGDEKNPPQKLISPVKGGSRGVVVWGEVSVDNGVGLLPIFPENFPQPAKVKKIHVVEGQSVEFDEVLIEFDTEHADIKVAEAKAGLDKAKGALQGALAVLNQAIQNDKVHALAVEAQEFAIKSKEAELAAARIDWEDKRSKAERFKAAMDPELLAAEKKLDAAQQALDGEKKKLAGLKIANPLQLTATKDRAEGGVTEAKAAVAVQEAQLKEAEYGKKLMTLKAPVAGKIVQVRASEGMMFGAQTRQPAFMLQTKGPIIVRAEVDQEFASRLVKGQDARITDDGDSTLKWNGKVIRISDSFLPKRSNFTPEGMMLNDVRVLECIVSIDVGTGSTPVRVGQKVKVSIGVE